MSSLAIRLVFTGIAVAIVAIFMVVGVDLGGMITNGGGPPIFIWWCLPTAGYIVGVRKRRVAIVGGIVMVFAFLGSLTALFRDSSSTAGIGFITLPVIPLTVVLISVAVDVVWRDRQSGS